MSRPNFKHLILGGAGAAACALAASWYSLTYNEGRLVYPTDFTSYEFQVKDLPMLFALGIVFAYVLYLIVTLIRYSLLEKRSRSGKYPGRTRKINPKLGYLGFLGFTGLLGFFIPPFNGNLSFLCFFVFFGFFGFFYEGKMSNILADERFMENKREAQRKAMSIGFNMIFYLIILVGIFSSAQWMNLIVTVLMSGICLIVGFVVFFSEYLLYRYDQEDSQEWKIEDDSER